MHAEYRYIDRLPASLRMLEPIPNKRATVDELLTDPWLDELEEDEGYVVHRHKCSSACRSSHYH